MEQITRDVVFRQQPRLHELQKKLGKFGGNPYIGLTGDLHGGCLPVLDLDEQIADGHPFALKTIKDISPKSQ